jgi:hypothetical protein
MSDRVRGSGQRLEALMAAMMGTSLTGAQRMVILALSRHASFKTGEGARPGHRTLADEAGVNRETVGRALIEAEELGLIVATRREKGRSTTYRILPGLAGSEGQSVAGSEGQSEAGEVSGSVRSLHDSTPSDDRVAGDWPDPGATTGWVVAGSEGQTGRIHGPDPCSETPVPGVIPETARAGAHTPERAHPRGGARASSGTHGRTDGEQRRRARRDILGMVAVLVRGGATTCDCIPRPPQFATDRDGVVRCPECHGIEPGQVSEAVEATGLR